MDYKSGKRRGEAKTNQPPSSIYYLQSSLVSYPKGISHALIFEKTEILQSERVVQHFVAQFIGVKANTRNILNLSQPSVLMGFILKEIPKMDTQDMTFRQYSRVGQAI